MQASTSVVLILTFVIGIFKSQTFSVAQLANTFKMKNAAALKVRSSTFYFILWLLCVNCIGCITRLIIYCNNIISLNIALWYKVLSFFEPRFSNIMSLHTVNKYFEWGNCQSKWSLTSYKHAKIFLPKSSDLSDSKTIGLETFF